MQLKFLPNYCYKEIIVNKRRPYTVPIPYLLLERKNPEYLAENTAGSAQKDIYIQADTSVFHIIDVPLDAFA